MNYGVLLVAGRTAVRTAAVASATHCSAALELKTTAVFSHGSRQFCRWLCSSMYYWNQAGAWSFRLLVGLGLTYEVLGSSCFIGLRAAGVLVLMPSLLWEAAGSACCYWWWLQHHPIHHP